MFLNVSEIVCLDSNDCRNYFKLSGYFFTTSLVHVYFNNSYALKIIWSYR